MEISDVTFGKICRICLLECGDMKSLFSKLDDDERNLFEVLAFTVDIDVKYEDTLPKQVCIECVSALCKADAFKRRCLDSETILNNAYQNSISKKNTSSTVENYSIKDENNDIKDDTNGYNSLVGTNVIILGTQQSSKVKDDLLAKAIRHESTRTNFCQITDSKLPVINEQPVKEEADIDFDDDTTFSDHYDIQTETIEYKEENTVKTERNSFSCDCGLTFNSKYAYETHLKEHCDKIKKNLKKNRRMQIISITKLGSTESQQKSPHILNTKIHQTLVSNDKQRVLYKSTYSCKLCLRRFKTQSSLAAHLIKHEITKTKSGKVNKTELHQCSLCIRKFKSETALQVHIKRHEATNSIKHICKICKREFKYKAYLDNHVLVVHSKKNGVSCEVCSKSFLNEESLELHRDSHDSQRKHQCTVCNKAFVMSCTLKEHMRTHTGEKPFLCSQCGRGFSQKTNLAQHVRRHQGLKPYKCENCEKSFVSKGELDAHNRKHSGAHPYICDDCGNGFTTSSALVKHRRIHTGEKPYLCDLCPMRFAASGTLTNHRRTHTGERPFQCSYCEKAFIQRNDLISHIRCHTGEKPYVCPHCGQSFRKASGLKSHIKMHDKEPLNALQGVSAMMNVMTEQ